MSVGTARPPIGTDHAHGSPLEGEQTTTAEGSTMPDYETPSAHCPTIDASVPMHDMFCDWCGELHAPYAPAELYA